ncbi:hypothetical protein [Actinoplanes sp. URMC 104]|uniref:hypothetical protein n=1 Tax=Actinoplanes sp. URMC 104 TaxID=3423409 RepID=UPI003F1C3837
MRGRRGFLAAVLLVSACGDPATTASPGASSDASPTPSRAAAWKSVEGGCPTVSGRTRITDGPFGNANGSDDATSYEVSCGYGDSGPVPELFVTIEIDRAHPERRDWSDKTNTAELAVRSAGNLMVELPGIGDGGFAIADKSADRTKPTVLAATWSGNAYISANVPLARPVRDEADLTGQADQLKAVLGDVLDDLRP